MTDAYAVSVRLLPFAPGGAPLAARDVRHPALGTSPTNTWRPGQIVGDYHELPIGVRLRPGTYRLQVVPYEVESGRELPWSIRAYSGGIDTPRQVTGTPYAAEIVVEAPVVEHPLDLVTWLLARR